MRRTNARTTGSETADWRWDAVQYRDRAADGQFVYAVTSTGIFCRPSCPSRRPRRDRVRFFENSSAAQRAGFRACRRCDPTITATSDDAIARASEYLTRHADETVSLATLARIARLSPFHLQRRFKRALGVSPREYQAACRAERFRRELRAGRDVTGAIYEAGYGSPSRVYDAAPTGRGMTPATYRRGGAGAEVGFVTVRCELGWLLVAATATGLCAVKLGDSTRMLEAELRRELPRADIHAKRRVPAAWVRAIVASVSGSTGELSLPLDVRATAFQWRVWRALQAIAPGETRSYSDVARQIGQPAAVRAVARACATNPVCLVVPCHRVIAKDGGLGGYRWGVTRKKRLLEGEQTASRDGRAGHRGQAK
ncbi:MAG TPA: bifunctional DNA-binding transcriptional regulator/O6-methylguanine-DNA methyltransferase Ada [Vicinamibacterales bacterium]|nr:bifunctional DNA-binding transcriptional regulator/O6-methylguanine-DNA methyltransferase Ada [Vicinamibacterales bacterium]